MQSQTVFISVECINYIRVYILEERLQSVTGFRGKLLYFFMTCTTSFVQLIFRYNRIP